VTPPSAPAADSDTLLADLQATRSLTVQWTLVGSLGFLLSFGVFALLYELLVGGPLSLRLGLDVPWWHPGLDLLALLLAGTLILVPHEWLHGLAIRYYGGKPRYGVGVSHFVVPYAYATTDHRFERNQFAVVLLAPLVGISLVGVPLMVLTGWGWLVLPLAANAGGAVVDCWMLLTVLGYPAHVTVEDHETGVRILGHPGDSPRPLSVGGLVWDALVGSASATVGLLVLFAVLGPWLLSALGVTSLVFGTRGTPTFLFAFESTATSVSFGFGPGVLVLGAAAGLGYAFVRSRRRQRRVRAEANDADVHSES
jgi:hypothetical protein